MIINPETTQKEKTKTNKIIAGILGSVLIICSICFTLIGLFSMGKALLTEYSLASIDLLYFTSGILMLFMIAIVNMLSELKNQNKAIAKGVLHLLKQKVNNTPSNQSPFGDILKNLFSRKPGMSDDEMTGSISLYDLSDPGNPIFQGDFKNSDEMNEVRKNLMDKMLNSKKEFNGKKMTKQEMLDSLNLKELNSELEIAIETEDWLWAASLRDKIAEKEKKDNTDL